MDYVIYGIICFCIFFTSLIATVILKVRDIYKMKFVYFILSLIEVLGMVSICIGFTCFDLQFMINNNNDYLVALYPIIALIGQFLLIIFQWWLFNWRRSDKKGFELGNNVYLLSMLLSLLMIIFVLYHNKASLLIWLRCLEYPIISLLSIYISPDLAFKLISKKK